MNSIARALNNIAYSLNSVASAISNSKKIEPKLLVEKTAVTSNPISNVKITQSTMNFSDDKNPSKMVHITQEEKQAIDSIYDALMIKGNHPRHHDDVMRQLEIKWPVLFKSLQHWMTIRRRVYNQKTSYYQENKFNETRNIWKG